MPIYNGNGIFLSIDGEDVSADFVSVSLEPSVESVDVTAGSGATHRERNEGLKDYSLSINLGYNTSNVVTRITKLAPGTHRIIFGPEGSTAGKLKHEQDFIIESAPVEISVGKDMVAFDISGVGAAAPISDMFAAATF